MIYSDLLKTSLPKEVRRAASRLVSMAVLHAGDDFEYEACEDTIGHLDVRLNHQLSKQDFDLISKVSSYYFVVPTSETSALDLIIFFK